MSAPDTMPTWLAIVGSALGWIAFAVLVKAERRRAARAALARMLAESGQHRPANDGPLNQDAEHDQHDGDRDAKHEGQLQVLDGKHAATLSTPPGQPR